MVTVLRSLYAPTPARPLSTADMAASLAAEIQEDATESPRLRRLAWIVARIAEENEARRSMNAIPVLGIVR